MPQPFAIYEPRRTEIAALIHHVDGYLTEEHELQVTLTRFPIESGASVTDHAVNEPDKLKLTGWTSDLFPADAANIPDTDRPAQAWAEIKRLARARQPLDVVTILGVYSNMVMTRALAPVTEQTGRGLLFTLEFEQVQTEPLRRVEFELVEPTTDGPASDRAVANPSAAPDAHSISVDEVLLVEAGIADPGGAIVRHARDTIGNVFGNLGEADFDGLANDFAEDASKFANRFGSALGALFDGLGDDE